MMVHVVCRTACFGDFILTEASSDAPFPSYYTPAHIIAQRHGYSSTEPSSGSVTLTPDISTSAFICNQRLLKHPKKPHLNNLPSFRPTLPSMESMAILSGARAPLQVEESVTTPSCCSDALRRQPSRLSPVAARRPKGPCHG